MSFWKQFWNEFVSALQGKVPTGYTVASADLTPRAKQVFSLARGEALRLSHSSIGPEHLLLGLVLVGRGVAFNVLRRVGCDPETIRVELEKELKAGVGPEKKVTQFTPRLKKVLALAGAEANHLGHTYLGTEHLLLGLLHEEDGLAAGILKSVNVERGRTRREVLKELEPHFRQPGDTEGNQGALA